VTQPGDQGWAYAGTFTDPDGHLWMVALDSSSVF
jgi:predicted lactoylglutathione lyase